MAVAGRGFRLVGDKELARKLKALQAAVVGAALGTAMDAGARPIQNAAKEKAPYKSGTLRRSITVVVTGGDEQKTATIGPSGSATAYAAQVEFGGTIKPKVAKMLHWVDPDTGEDIFAHAVTQVARPYLRPAFDENVDEAERKAAAVFKVLIEKASA